LDSVAVVKAALPFDSDIRAHQRHDTQASEDTTRNSHENEKETCPTFQICSQQSAVLSLVLCDTPQINQLEAVYMLTGQVVDVHYKVSQSPISGKYCVEVWHVDDSGNSILFDTLFEGVTQKQAKQIADSLRYAFRTGYEMGVYRPS
jgi:hypothetical protein